MNDNNKPTRSFRILSGLCGIIGVLMLIISFNINPGPPQEASIEQLSSFAHRFYASILWGAWLQAVGPAFIVVFAFALVKLAGARDQLAGMMTIFGANALMTVSLMEITMYIGALFEHPQNTGLISLNIIYAIQHLYFIIAAPAFFIPLGMLIIQSKVLHRLFGFSAISLGILFAGLGIAFLKQLVMPPGVTALAGIQVLWWISASLGLIIKGRKDPF
ncbi:MAG: hypothetical protein ACHQET_12320 [Chitinophagales bacterium]